MKTFEKLTAANFPLVLEARGVKVAPVGKEKCAQVIRFLDKHAKYQIVDSKIAFLVRLAKMEDVDDKEFWAFEDRLEKKSKKVRDIDAAFKDEIREMQLFATIYGEAIQMAFDGSAHNRHNCIAQSDGSFKLCCKFEGTNIFRHSNEIEAKARMFPIPVCWQLL